MKKSLYFLSLISTFLLFFIASCGDSNVKPLDTTAFQKLKFHFEDKDPAKNMIKGEIVLNGASTLTEVKRYIIYWGNRPSSSGQSLQLKSIQKPSKDILLSIEQGIPIKEDYLLLYFKGADGKEIYSKKFIKIKDLAPQQKVEKSEIQAAPVSPLISPEPVTAPIVEEPTQEEPEVAPVSSQKDQPEPKEPDSSNALITPPVVAPTTPVPSASTTVTTPEVSNSSTSSNNTTIQPMMIFIENILFKFDRSSLSQEYIDHLMNKLSDIEDKEIVKLRIEGHADERGSNEYNLALGEKRAYAVKKFLVTMGFSEENVEIVSFGEEKPASKGHNESSWSKNRRAVTEIKEKK